MYTREHGHITPMKKKIRGETIDLACVGALENAQIIAWSGVLQLRNLSGAGVVPIHR